MVGRDAVNIEDAGPNPAMCAMFGFYIDGFSPGPVTEEQRIRAYQRYLKTLGNDELIAEFYRDSLNRGHEYLSWAMTELYMRLK